METSLEQQYDYEADLKQRTLQEGAARSEAINQGSITSKQQPKLDMVDFFISLFFAAVFDALSLIPVIGNIISVCGLCLLWLWFWIKGIKGIGIWGGGGSVIEAIPALSAIPANIAFVIIVFVKDRAGAGINKLPGPAKIVAQSALQASSGKLPTRGASSKAV